MKCRLCGQPTAGPDKLCGDCTKALRRAREGSAAARRLPLSPAQEGEPKVATTIPRPLALASVPPPGWRRRVAWAAVGLVTIGVIYLGLREPIVRPAPDAVVVDDRAPTPAEQRPGLDSGPGSTVLEILPSAERVNTADVPPLSAPPQAKSAINLAQRPALRATAQTPPRAKAGTGGAKASTTLEPGSGSSPYPNLRAADAAQRNSNAGAPSETATPQPLMLARAPPSEAATDGAQILAGALAKCSGEKFLAGVICEQKVRLQYCEGKWGTDPQCMIRTRTD